jgi:predicted ATPase/DNA-binding winged helix-turn-helix (wHTH) protein
LLAFREGHVSDQAIASADLGISFGPFRLFPARQLLLEADKPVRLGSRALDILVALLERRGDLISKEDLIARVWPNTFVEEGNLRVHMAALRRALGDGQAGNRFIATVPGRGYRFVSPVSISQDSGPPLPPPTTVERAHDLPRPLTRMVGRADVVETLAGQLQHRRFITLVGPGGIGKTTVALAVTEKLIESFEDRALLIDLAPVADPRLVPSTLASALGVAVVSDNPIPELIAFLRDRRMLLVLDSCEHVIEAAAALAQEMLKGAPGVHILATSREPLRAEGERVQRLLPLEFPPASDGLAAADALRFPAVQLFVERAAATLEEFELSDAEAPIVAEICRRLDGIALAIELAASRVDAFGVRGLAALLDDRFRLLMRGRRTALPRHQTLAAALDWSYAALLEDERVVLRRLGVFVGDFTLEAASAIASDGENASGQLVDVIADLVAKSLVSADVSGTVVYYRLLDTTRAYAREKLAAGGEAEQLARRHAEYYRDLFKRAEAEWETMPTKDWLAAYGRKIDNVRAALEWAFSPSGDVAVGVALTVAAVPLWFQLSLINECRERIEQALSTFDPQQLRGDSLEMKLYAARGWSLMYTAGSARETGANWAIAHDLAERLGDTDYRLRSLWGLWAGKINNGEFIAARELADRFSRLALESADSPDRPIGDRLMGASLHFLGDQAGARHHIERMLSRYIAPVHRSDVVRFQFDQRVTAKITHARVLWLQGFVEQAMRVVDASVNEAQALDHTLTLCNVLAQSACPIALLAGDLERADRFTAMLLQRTERHALEIWHVYAGCYRGQLVSKRGDIEGGLRLVRAAVNELRGARFVQYYTAFLTALAEMLAGAGQAAEAVAAIDEALTQSERNNERWCTPEMLRVKGEVALRRGMADGSATAEKHFVESLDWARRQQALSWELRAATSFARLRRDQGRTAEARNLLADVYGRFTEGFGTADLTTAKTLLDELA